MHKKAGIFWKKIPAFCYSADHTRSQSIQRYFKLEERFGPNRRRDRRAYSRVSHLPQNTVSLATPVKGLLPQIFSMAARMLARLQP